MGPLPVEVGVPTQLQVLAALESLVLPRMVLTRMVLVFLDPLEDAKALVPLGGAVRLSMWFRPLLAATLTVPWRRPRGTGGAGRCWRAH